MDICLPLGVPCSLCATVLFPEVLALSTWLQQRGHLEGFCSNGVSASDTCGPATISFCISCDHMQDQQQLEPLARLEMPLVRVLADVETTGIAASPAVLDAQL